MKRKRCEAQSEMCSPADWIRQDDWPVGIRNVGNTCWFSAVIQVKKEEAEQLHQIHQHQGQNLEFIAQISSTQHGCCLLTEVGQILLIAPFFILYNNTKTTDQNWAISENCQQTAHADPQLKSCLFTKMYLDIIIIIFVI